MSLRDEINKLAREILGKDAHQMKDFSQVESCIIPEQGKPATRPWSSPYPDNDNIEVLPKYKFIHEVLQLGCPALFVTGRAGTGKSTLIHWLMNNLDNAAVVAPTAIAALNVGGDTIHSFFCLPPTHIDPKGIIWNKKSLSKKRAAIVMENIRYLIVDEVSMLLPNIVDAMNIILQRVRRSDKPFGGVSIVFIGDLLQLPPVVRTREQMIYYSHYYKTRYFFSAKVFTRQAILPVDLTEVRRQADPDFINALDHIRVKHDHEEHVQFFNRKCFRGEDHAQIKSGVYLVPTNNSAQERNKIKLDKLAKPLRVYEATITGAIHPDWKPPVPSNLGLKEGARIIFIKNNKPEWINGDLGIVIGLKPDHIRIKKMERNNVVIVEREEWNKIQYRYNDQTQKIEQEVVGTYRQFPIRLGWAITIHKSQGMTLDHLTLDLAEGAFAEGQTYVALSRAINIEGITLARPIEMRDIKVDSMVLEFYKELGISIENHSK